MSDILGKCDKCGTFVAVDVLKMESLEHCPGCDGHVFFKRPSAAKICPNCRHPICYPDDVRNDPSHFDCLSCGHPMKFGFIEDRLFYCDNCDITLTDEGSQAPPRCPLCASVSRQLQATSGLEAVTLQRTPEDDDLCIDPFRFYYSADVWNEDETRSVYGKKLTLVAPDNIKEYYWRSACDHCGLDIEAPLHALGKAIECPHCGSPSLISGPKPRSYAIACPHCYAPITVEGKGHYSTKCNACTGELCVQPIAETAFPILKKDIFGLCLGEQERYSWPDYSHHYGSDFVFEFADHQEQATGDRAGHFVSFGSCDNKSSYRVSARLSYFGSAVEAIAVWFSPPVSIESIKSGLVANYGTLDASESSENMFVWKACISMQPVRITFKEQHQAEGAWVLFYDYLQLAYQSEAASERTEGRADIADITDKEIAKIIKEERNKMVRMSEKYNL